jgi:hypothetical protein
LRSSTLFVLGSSLSLVLAACVPQQGAIGIEESFDRSGGLTGPEQGEDDRVPAGDATLASSMAMVVGAPAPIVSAEGGVSVVFSGVVVPDPGTTTPAQAVYDLSWEGEELEASLDAVVGEDSGILYAGGHFIEQRVGEERVVSLSLELHAEDVAVGDTIPGTLFYGESAIEPDWLDVLLGAPVEVEVVPDAAVPGALSLRVAEVSLQPQFDVGVMRAGQLYEGPYDLVVDPTPQVDCPALTVDQLSFVGQSLADLAAEQNEVFDPVMYAGLTRGAQGQDPMKPFLFTSQLVDVLTSFNGSKSVLRVPESGGVVQVDFLANVVGFGTPYAGPMELREGPGMFEVARRVTIDGRTWGPGFDVSVERFYADDPDATLEEAGCTTTFDATLQTFTP